MANHNHMESAGQASDVVGYGRLTGVTDREEFRPWIKAQTLEGTCLYWLPVGGYPMGHDQRAWLLNFLDRWTRALSSERGLRSELFLQYKATAGQDMAGDFERYVLKNHVLTGVTRKPGSSLPTFPPAEEMRKFFAEGKTVNIEEWVADFCYWLLSKRVDEQRSLFAGSGALTTIFLPPDPNTVAPKSPFTPKFRQAMPVFSQFDVDATVQSAFSMKDAFLLKSKQLFGAGLENDPIYPGIAYIIPLLESGHFFAATPEERCAWFSLFEVYLNESPKDKGVIMAFQGDFETMLIALLRSLREEGQVYPVTWPFEASEAQ